MRFRDYLICEGIIDTNISFVDKLNSIKNKIVGKNLGTIEIIDLINNKLSHFNIKLSQKGFGGSDNPEYSKVYIRNAVSYDSGLIEISIEDNFYEIFEYDDIWNDFLKTLKRIISHELIHREQINKVKNKAKNKSGEVLSKLADNEEDTVQGTGNIRKYLSNKWEAMAFAKEAVQEFKDIGYSNKDILNRIKNPFNNNIYPSNSESHVFYRYTDYFESGEVPLQRFLKYMQQYLVEKTNKKDSWIEKLSDNELNIYKKKHPDLTKKTAFLIQKEIYRRKTS